MTNINGSFQDTYKDPNTVPSFNGVTEKDFMEFENMPEIEDAIEHGQKNTLAIQYADFIRRQGYGSVVRESIARLSLYLNVQMNAIESKNSQIYLEYESMQKELEAIRKEFETLISSQTIDGEVKLARHSEFFKRTFPSLQSRLDYIENDHYFTQTGEIHMTRTLIDDDFSKNHEVATIGEVTDPTETNPIIIATVDDTKQNRFKLVKVGEV